MGRIKLTRMQEFLDTTADMRRPVDRGNGLFWVTTKIISETSEPLMKSLEEVFRSIGPGEVERGTFSTGSSQRPRQYWTVEVTRFEHPVHT